MLLINALCRSFLKSQALSRSSLVPIRAGFSMQAWHCLVLEPLNHFWPIGTWRTALARSHFTVNYRTWYLFLNIDVTQSRKERFLNPSYENIQHDQGTGSTTLPLSPNHSHTRFDASKGAILAGLNPLPKLRRQNRSSHWKGASQVSSQLSELYYWALELGPSRHEPQVRERGTVHLFLI